MTFAIGDVLVYANHGVGHVAARRTTTILGAEQDIVVLQFEDGLTVSLPVERAREQLRPLASEAELRRVQKTLRQKVVVDTEPWQKRQRAVAAKLSGGGAETLAELVRDGATRAQAFATEGQGKQLSPGEREVLSKARHLLASEVARVRGLSDDDAERWIDDQLDHTADIVEGAPSDERPPRTAAEFRARLAGLLTAAAVTLPERELPSLGVVVRERRNAIRGRTQTPAPARVRRCAQEIVTLLEEASRVLRPRETQELDDLVAGKTPPPVVVQRTPVRRHRH